MTHHTRWALPAVLFVAALAAAPGSGADGKHHGSGVKLTIVTDSQSSLLSSGQLEVRVKTHGRAKLVLSARQGVSGDLVDPETVKLKHAGRRFVRLHLTDKGRAALGACGPQEVTVEGTHKRKGKKHRAVALATARLAAASADCSVPVKTSEPCDPIDAANCMAPYPNDYFTVPDGSTPTGLRVHLDPASVPKNLNGVPAFSPEYNRNDGFSPNNIILTRIPGIETPAAFKANDLVPQEDIGKYDDPAQRVLLIDTATGDRVPIWAEVDMVPGTPNPHDNGSVNGTVNDRLLLIHPAVQLDYGHRYIVALRNLTDDSAVPLNPNPVFKAYRDGIPIDNAAAEARRPHMESIFSKLGSAGVARSGLYIAWDFTVASEGNLTGRLLAMRNDAFAQLGDTDLDDDQVDGASPPITIDNANSFNFALCNDGSPRCELNGATYSTQDGGAGPWTAVPGGFRYDGTSQSHYAFREIRGTIGVPCYMNAPGSAYNTAQPNVPCAPGSRLHYAAGADVPSQNGNVTWQAPFTCIIPRTAQDATTGATGRHGVVFGHGLLQNNRIVEQLGLFPGAMAGVACGTDWIGLSAVDPITGQILPQGDLFGFLLNMILNKQDLSQFSAVPDRSQQGYVNTLYLARAMAAPDGFASKAEFKPDPMGTGPSALAVNPNNVSADLGYYGVSLGGIFGAATTSVAPDWQRAVLAVPGVGFSTLLSRSTEFNQFLPYIYDDYPDALSREIGVSMLQLVWDRGDPSAYLPHLTDDPLPDTPPHKVMIQEAFGDHQVANVQTETMARTIGAAVRTPTTDPGPPARVNDRTYLFSDTVNPFFPGQDQITSTDLNVPNGYTGSSSVLYTFDTGPIRIDSGRIVGTNPNLDWDIAPVDERGLGDPQDGLDPHEPSATSPSAQEMAIPFLLDGGFYDSCVTPFPGDPMDWSTWTGPFAGTPQPCSAPPVHSLGQGE